LLVYGCSWISWIKCSLAIQAIRSITISNLFLSSLSTQSFYDAGGVHNDMWGCSIDNSEWMRNGDFVPTRLQCQQEAANMLVQNKLNANPENTVGLISLAGTVEVLVMATRRNGQIFTKLHQAVAKGLSDFVGGVKVAHMALKHRPNVQHKMRIILFVGSPIPEADIVELKNFAKQLRKDDVQTDVICFGEGNSSNAQVMRQFVQTVNGRQRTRSNLLVVPSGGSSLMEALMSSSICRQDDIPSTPATVLGSDVNAESDPELAMALRISLEEERRNQQQRNGAANGPTQAPPSQHSETAQRAGSAGHVTHAAPTSLSEQQQLEWALNMSMQDNCANAAERIAPTSGAINAFLPSTQQSSTQTASASVVTGEQIKVDVTQPSSDGTTSIVQKDPSKPDSVQRP
uniref:26S proteasome non-ATPase regulatory subunit 4 n=1 Tax=Parascaris univalens TaxID=6257 RepID=A0A914ZYL3_PARUN